MRITVLAVGRLKSGPETELVARYVRRAKGSGRAVGVTAIELVELPEARGPSAAERCRTEADQLLLKVPDGAFLVLLDEHGKTLPSEDLAHRLRDLAEAGRKDLVFAIGGPDGHGQAVRDRADLAVSFGSATWPHQLVRVMLFEQIYRAMTILTGHPYHRA